MMALERIDKIQTTFQEIYSFIEGLPGSKISNLLTTGGVIFEASAKITRDGRKYISLPHNNRIYKDDWGYRYNSMGKDGQRIGHYSISINNEYLRGQK